MHRHWRLNERMYGALQGKNKAQTAAEYGEDQVKVRWISFDGKLESLKEFSSRFGVELMIFLHQHSMHRVNTIHEMIVNSKYIQAWNSLDRMIIFVLEGSRSTCFAIN